MIKIIWIACSIVVFVHTIKACIKSELDTYDGIDGALLFLFLLISFLASLLGPFAIIAYFVYNALEGVAQAINKAHDENN